MANTMMDEVDVGSEKLSRQTVGFFLHAFLALAAWVLFMAAGYLLNTPMPQMLILALSAAIPLVVGYFVVRSKPNEMAGHVWLLGLILMLIICLWILDMPTGPNACLGCGAAEKLTRTLFSIPSPSGLIDNNGPLFATWPAAALLGYSIGAKLALRKTRTAEPEQ
jgi:heme/copper-type cytochrome/quinol oxidase subunit 4